MENVEPFRSQQFEKSYFRNLFVQYLAIACENIKFHYHDNVALLLYSLLCV